MNDSERSRLLSLLDQLTHTVQLAQRLIAPVTVEQPKLDPLCHYHRRAGDPESWMTPFHRRGEGREPLLPVRGVAGVFRWHRRRDDPPGFRLAHQRHDD